MVLNGAWESGPSSDTCSADPGQVDVTLSASVCSSVKREYSCQAFPPTRFLQSEMGHCLYSAEGNKRNTKASSKCPQPLLFYNMVNNQAGLPPPPVLSRKRLDPQICVNSKGCRLSQGELAHSNPGVWECNFSAPFQPHPTPPRDTGGAPSPLPRTRPLSKCRRGTVNV